MNRGRAGAGPNHVLGGALLLGFCLCFAVATTASDFDFYGQDIIARESYRKISMDFRDASLKNILKIFSEQAGLNFIAAQSVGDRSITLYLDQVPLQEALSKIMTANNLAYEMETGSNIFIVKETGRPAVDLLTRVYVLKYTRLKASKLQKEIDSAAAALSLAAGGSTTTTTSGSGGGEGSIEDSIKNILTSNGKVISDLRTNSLIVTDVPAQFDVIEKVIALLDTPTPQVMIEVEMLDVSKSTIDELGVNMTKTLGQITGSDVSTRFPNFLLGPRRGYVERGEATFTYGTISTSVFTAALEFLTTDSTTKFLARPRILTLSNETAEIKIVTEEAIGQNTVQTSSQGTATTSTQAERFETGVSLRVTPQVDSVSGMVTMYIVPTVAEAKAGATFNDTTYKDPETRSSASTLMVRDGETIVVGGLIRNKDETTIKKWPVVGDLPVVGALFRHKSQTVQERELLVFITPHVVGYENAAVVARGTGGFPEAASVTPREQSVAVGRQEQVDNMLERWEN